MSADYHYPTELSDEPWELLNCLLPQRAWPPGGRGRPPSWDVRGIVNGILYLNKTGCQWRMIPQDLGHWSTLYGYFKRWRQGGLWASLMETLRQGERRWVGRPPEPSAGSMDSQSIKTATPHEDIGFDGNKRSKGRKRHLLVDTLGLIIAVGVTDASTDDRLGLVELLLQWTDDSYSGDRFAICPRMTRMACPSPALLRRSDRGGPSYGFDPARFCATSSASDRRSS